MTCAGASSATPFGTSGSSLARSGSARAARPRRSGERCSGVRAGTLPADTTPAADARSPAPAGRAAEGTPKSMPCMCTTSTGQRRSARSIARRCAACTRRRTASVMVRSLAGSRPGFRRESSPRRRPRPSDGRRAPGRHRAARAPARRRRRRPAPTGANGKATLRTVRRTAGPCSLAPGAAIFRPRAPALAFAGMPRSRDPRLRDPRLHCRAHAVAAGHGAAELGELLRHERRAGVVRRHAPMLGREAVGERDLELSSARICRSNQASAFGR